MHGRGRGTATRSRWGSVHVAWDETGMGVDENSVASSTRDRLNYSRELLHTCVYVTYNENAKRCSVAKANFGLQLTVGGAIVTPIR